MRVRRVQRPPSLSVNWQLSSVFRNCLSSVRKSPVIHSARSLPLLQHAALLTADSARAAEFECLPANVQARQLSHEEEEGHRSAQLV
ncbi:hypothetical protein BaRGS_00005361 [Batillaria attramentaria]|uniref:Uncharacterized protein n=1 Tax=Batillaria attramentaria TaxID=370345 RepID=A0ABD0LVC9_9CAEN